MKKYNVVFYVSLCISIAFLVFGATFPKWLEHFSNTFLNFIYDKLGWLLLLSVFIMLVFCLYIGLSKFGKIKLGKDSDVPEYRTVTWIAMLFSAGIGISLVFWGVAEPVSYYLDPPIGEGGTKEAAEQSMQFVYLHWGVSAWACYALVGACLAYFQFRKDLPATLSSAFYPVIGDRIYGPIGKTIDIVVMLSVVVGISTSLGFGVLQINSGLEYQWGISNSVEMQMLIITIVTLIYLWSASTGIKRGIKYLSNANVILAVVLLLSIFFLGPTQEIMKIFFQGIGDYLNNFLGMSFRTDPYGDGSWIASWTLFYFGWWIAWAPLVGSFVARISKGRTLREFMIGALFIPVLFSFFWFAVLGGSALDLIQNQGVTQLADTVASDVTVALFDFFSYFPMSELISIVGMVLIFTFFITSADSAMFVLGMISENGNQNPANITKITWGVVIAVVSALLVVTGGLDGLQSSLVAMAVPLSILLLGMCYSMYKGLRMDYKTESDKKENHENRGA